MIFIVKRDGKEVARFRAAKTFLDYIGLDISERRGLPIEITPNNEYLVEIKIPMDFFKTKQQHLRLEKSKAAG